MKKIFLLFVVFLLLQSCKKNSTGNNSNNNTNENILSSNSHIVDTIAIASITDNSITLLKNNTQLRPKINDILLGAPSSFNEYTFLRKVISVTENTNQIVCITEQSNLNDAFEQLNFDYTYLDTFSANNSFRTTSGASWSVSFNANDIIANGITLSGTLKFNMPSTKIEYKKKKGSLLPDKILIQTEFNTNESSLEIKNSGNLPITVLKEDTLKILSLPTFRVPIPIPLPPFGVVVIPIPFTQQLVLKVLPFSISGKAKVSLHPIVTATLGAKYENSTWTNLSTYSIDATSLSLSPADFIRSASLTANLTIFKPVYEVKPLNADVLKFFFSVANNLELAIQNTQPNYSLKYKVDVTGGIKSKFWFQDEKEFSITGNITKTILEGNWSRTVPVLTTGSVSSITQTSATSGGDIVDDGGDAIVARGVCWSTSSNPTIANSKTNDGLGNGSYVSNITGLAVNTPYFARAYATNSVGTAYGNEVSFATLQANLPILTTNNISSIAQTSAISGGNISSDGGTSITARGVCWSTSSNPTIANSKTNDGTGIGTFTSNLTGLTLNTRYFVRAYGTNSVGTGYGNEISFQTLSGSITLISPADGTVFHIPAGSGTVHVTFSWSGPGDLLTLGIDGPAPRTYNVANNEFSIDLGSAPSWYWSVSANGLQSQTYHFSVVY